MGSSTASPDKGVWLDGSCRGRCPHLPRSEEEKTMKLKSSRIGLGIGLGVVIGTIGSVLSGSMAFWLPTGMGLGIALGLMGSGVCFPGELSNEARK